MNNMTDLISKKIRTREKDCFTDDRLTLCECRYLVQASGVCAGYSFLSALVSALPRPSTMFRAWTFFVLDQVELNSK